MHNRVIFIMVCAIVVIFSTIGFPGCSSSRSSGSHLGIQISQDIISALQEIVSIRQEELSIVRDKHEMGYVSYIEVEDAQNKLSEARIRLATAEHRHDVIIEELRKILAIHENRLRWVETKVEQGVASSQDVADAKIQLLEARIRLATAIAEKD